MVATSLKNDTPSDCKKQISLGFSDGRDSDEFASDLQRSLSCVVEIPCEK